MISAKATFASHVLCRADNGLVVGKLGSVGKQGLVRSAAHVRSVATRKGGLASSKAVVSSLGFKDSLIAYSSQDVTRRANTRGSNVSRLHANGWIDPELKGSGGEAENANPYSDAKSGGGDVYVIDTPDELNVKLLKDGVRRHTISVYVADERGLINRVAGVFARRGFNIESLAVGLWGKNMDKALFTIAVLTDDKSVKALIKQVYKLPSVREIRLVTDVPVVQRGLVLFKVKVSDNKARTELLETVNVFRGNIVDVSENSMIIAMTGDPGKGIAMQRYLQKFGILQIARTGKVALRRELREERKREREGNELEFAREEGTMDRPEHEYPEGIAEVGVYSGNTDGDWLGIFESDFVESEEDGLQPGLSSHTVSILVDNMAGVLDRVTGVVARRGYNVQSLAVGPAEKRGVSRITLVIPGTDKSVEKLLCQLRKLVSVLDAVDLTGYAFVERELCLVKVLADRSLRSEILDIAAIFRAKVSDVSRETVVLEVVGDTNKTAAMMAMLTEYGIVEVARTGRVALARDSGVDSRLLDQMEMETFF
eukprot:CAMPEP_0198228710 /NCGR_PEP_ID=MMETSP1445-20131203/113740_1 /TAXON_ID=36898 /ORGANISM="Pyramimonas sp., Strain CCMP2087" /LENGTH=540 /DNA_ID=CAMNT_0043909129 /DNA_START=82 /DNA_END=1704 /DNA_ORIENTATION=-